MKNNKTPLLTTTIINTLERSCGPFKGGGKNPLLSKTLGQFAPKEIIIIIKNNDHGVSVNIVMVI